MTESSTGYDKPPVYSRSHPLAISTESVAFPLLTERGGGRTE